MSRISSQLRSNETILWKGKPVLKSLCFAGLNIRLIFFPLVCLFTLFVYATITRVGPPFLFYLYALIFFCGPPFAIAFAKPISVALAHRNTEYVITNQRVIIQTGRLKINTRFIDVEKIQEVIINFGLVDKIFGTGSIYYDTASISSVWNQLFGRSSGGYNNMRPNLIALKEPYKIQKLLQEAKRNSVTPPRAHMEEFFRGRTRFIITSELEDLKDTGSIMGTDGKIIAFFEHMHSWKTRNGPKWWLNKKKAKTTDIQFVGIDKTLLGEIHEIPPPMMSRIIRKWEIYNSKNELEGIVREKPEFIGSSWVLENLEGKVIAAVKGNRKKKEFKILTKGNETVARCYRSEKIGKKSYYVDTNRSEIDLFLVLSYIIVLDLAKTAWISESTS